MASYYPLVLAMSVGSTEIFTKRILEGVTEMCERILIVANTKQVPQWRPKNIRLHRTITLIMPT